MDKILNIDNIKKCLDDIINIQEIDSTRIVEINEVVQKLDFLLKRIKLE
jgi:hypothetical protein